MPDSSGNRPPADEGGWLEGRPVLELHGNEPWMLDDRERCRAVTAGSVDVFAVRVDADGRPGARRHVARAGAGQLLCGGAWLADAGGAGGLTLLVVPSSTASVVDLSRGEVEELLADPFERLLMVLAISEWAETLSASLPQARRPFESVAAAPGTDLALPAGSALTARGGAACVRLTSGSARLVSDAAMQVSPGSGWIPLTGDVWLEADDDAVYEVMYLAEALRSDPGLRPVDGLYDLLTAGLSVRLRRADDEETARLQRRDDSLRRAFARTLAQQAAVLDTETVAAEGGDDDLLATCRVIGARLGVRFRPPPASWRGKVYDPVSAIARASHVRYRQVALDGEWWRRDNGPLLAFTAEDETPVALIPASGRRYRAHLPGAARPARVDATLAATLRPTATMFYRPLPERPLRGRDVLAYVLRGSRRDVASICLLGLLAAVIGLALPMFTNVVFSSIVPSGDRSALNQIAALLLVIAVTLGVFSYTRGVTTVRVQARIDSELQAAIWDRLLALPPSFFRGFTAGDLATRVMYINQISAIFFNLVLASLLTAVFSLVNLLLIFSYSSALALLSLVLLLVATTVSISVALLQLRERRKMLDLQGRLSGVVLQFVSAVAKLRDTGAEERAFMRWSDGFVEMTRHTIKATRLTIAGNVFNAAFPLVCSVGAFAVFFYAERGSYLTGQFMAFTTAFAQLLAGLLALSIALVALTTAAPLYERTRPILQATPEVDETKADPGELLGHIELSHVTFSYDPESPPTISDLSLSVQPGEFVAIVGPSGAGKSTLFRLLLGFDKPESGEIHYDGQDLRALDLGALRRQVSTVLQNGRVFSGSIQLNIAGGAQLTQDELWEAARAAGLAEDIEAMPMGMFTYVAEGGVTLSGGQRQRLLIARALATRPAVLFFDEATSALDNRTQALVMQSLEKLNATRVVIAQRLSTVRAADRIYVIEDGRVAQHGSYDDLISRPGLFRRLAARQLV